MSLGGVALIGISMLFAEAIGPLPDYAQEAQVEFESNPAVGTAQVLAEEMR